MLTTRKYTHLSVKVDPINKEDINARQTRKRKIPQHVHVITLLTLSERND
jgi:hypothetical protein